MISKSLVHNIVTFCNNYINNKCITCVIDILFSHIGCAISIWELDDNGHLDICKHTYYGHIENINDFINYKRKVLKTIDTYMYEVKTKKIKVKKDELVFCGYDSWDRPTWKYKNIYLKDISLKGSDANIPTILYDTADEEMDGEPNNPYEITLI